MNEQDRAELERLKRLQEALQIRVSGLQVDIERLAARMNAAAITAPEIVPLEAPPLMATEAIAPPPIPAEPAAVPPPLPPIIPAQPAPVPAPAPVFHQEELPHEDLPKAPAAPTATAAPAPRDSFEMKLGTYWLVRIGIVMLLTGLVFLGTYAYKNYIGKLPPTGKIALLYTAGAALLGFGGWLQRKRETEGMRNYGQVLFAGGLATVYFTTYAAHYIERLKVIQSPVVDALLLLAWSAVIVWIADRRKSEVLALFAIGLSYYTSAITDVGLFTLGSNLVLTAAAVFFLIRNRWITLSFISVFATYGGFAFWRFHDGDWSWAGRMGELGPACFFLAGYWLFFTAAVFLSRGSKLVNIDRAIFASLNNAAFFSLTLLSTIHVWPGTLWKLSIGFGAALLGAAALGSKVLENEPAVKNAYVVQGLTLVTVGFIDYFAGMNLALVLAAESVVLTFLGRQRGSWFLRGGACITAALSIGWTLVFLKNLRPDLWIGSAIGAGMLLNAWWEHRHDAERGALALRPFSGYFTALALIAWGAVTWHATPRESLPVVWMIEAVLLTASFYVLRVPDVPVLAQGLVVAAQGLWFFEFAMRAERPHWLVPATLVAGTLLLSHWWQRQKRLAVDRDVRNVLQIVYALALIGVAFFWSKPEFAPAAWLVFLCLLAVGVTIYGVVTRAWALAACAQVFLLVSSTELLRMAAMEKQEWQFALVPIATWLVLGIATTVLLTRLDTRDEVRRPLLHVSTFYRAVAVAMSLWWIFTYVTLANRFWTFSLVGLGVLAMAGALRSREALVFSGVFLAVGFATWFVTAWDGSTVVKWPNALSIIAVLAAQQIVRRMPERFAVPSAVESLCIVIASGALWMFVSRWVVLTAGSSFLLTVSWAAVAAVLFAAGFILRERMHRWVGLGILACAVTRVFLLDVWKFETIYRILSFTALGIVLLALGFIYNKYQDKIRQWL
jgi:hypothetical protein